MVFVAFPLLLAGIGFHVGDARLSVGFDETSGWPTTWTVDGTSLLVKDSKTKTPVRVNDEKPWQNLEKDAPAAVVEKFECLDDATAKSWLRVGDWRFAVTVWLYPERRMARRRFSFCWDGTMPTQKLDRLWFEGGKFLTQNGSILLPGSWPLRESTAPFHDGLSRRTGGGRSGGPAPIICDNGADWSVLSCLDETTPCADRGQSHLMERADGLTFSTFYETCGRMRKGDWQDVGDAWFVFRRGSTEEMLTKGLDEWFRYVGEVTPADRADWLKDAVMYSTHPKGDGNEGMLDRGGFRAEADYLPFLKALGVNTIWLRPVEDESCYVPRDYYSLMTGIGSAEDFKTYVRRAHGLGMRVMRDGVIHGGFSTSRNPRAVTHPEWIGQYYDGSVAEFWCFDFNWPTWVGYIGAYIRHQTAEYDLDGWRLDATSGSRHPNWNPLIPYKRASFSQLQGALNQLRSIRTSLKSVRKDGALLTESHLGAFAKYSDSIYDEWNVGVRVMDEIAREGAAGPIRKLRRWFHEQQYAFPPDTINMRYIDNHDTISAADTHGRAAATAMMAVMSWTPGYPQVCNFREDGAFEALRRIFLVRAALPELRRGTADYLGINAPDGVFACRRALGDLESIVYVNFNSVPVADLTPFGYRVVRTKGPSVESVLGELPPFVPERTATQPVPKTPSSLAFELEAEGRTIPVLVELRDWTNGIVRTPYRLVREKTATGWHVSLAEPTGGRGFSNLKLVVQTATADRWYARTAEGVFENPFRVRHPDYDALNPRHTIGGAPRDGAMRWQSKTHPFGLTRETASVGVTFGETALEYHGFADAADVRVWDRLGRDAGLAVSVYGSKLSSYAIDIDLTTVAKTIGQPVIGTGDSRLKVVPGGWCFEEGTLRVNVLRNGAIASVFRKRGNTWFKIVGEAGFYTDTGTGRKVNTGETPTVCKQSYECECPVQISRTSEGSLCLNFPGGEMRSAGRHSSRMAKPIKFWTSYMFNGDESFVYGSSMQTCRTFEKGSGVLDWRMELVDCKGGMAGRDAINLNMGFGGKLDLNFTGWKGEPARQVVRYGNSIHVVWLGKTTEGLVVSAPSQNGFSALVRIDR